LIFAAFGKDRATAGSGVQPSCIHIEVVVSLLPGMLKGEGEDNRFGFLLTGNLVMTGTYAF
jgi:hypothetical protein